MEAFQNEGLFKNSGMLSVAMTTTMMMVMRMRRTTKALCGECGSWLCCYFCCDTVRPTACLPVALSVVRSGVDDASQMMVAKAYTQ